jgi:hypothetical protein
VQLEHVDVVGLQPAQRAVHRTQQPGTRRAAVVGSGGQAGLGGNQHVVTSAAQRLTEYLLGGTVGIHVRGVDEVNARFEGEVDQPTCLFDVGIAPGSEELTSLPANVAVPRLNSDTSRPELPTRRYSMIPP